MVEYGNAVDQGSRATGGGGGVGGGGADLGAGAVNFVYDTVHQVQALPPETRAMRAVVPVLPAALALRVSRVSQV